MKRKIKFLAVSAAFALSCFLQGTSKQKITIACAGDSLMRPVPLYLRRLLPMKHLAIKEWARGGLSAANYSSFFLAHPHWQQVRVDIILLQLGTNDVPLFLRNEENEELFISHYRRLIKEFRKLKSNYFHRPIIIVATAPPFLGIEGETERNRLIEEVINPAIKRLAKEERLFLLDHWPRFKGQPNLYNPDGVHPNSEGEKLIARHWRRVIRRVWLASKVKNYKKISFEF